MATSGNVTDETIMEYIRLQDGTEPDVGGDNFQITEACEEYFSPEHARRFEPAGFSG